MNKKVWVTGAGGQLGKTFLSLYPKIEGLTYIPTLREEVNLADKEAVFSFLKKEMPDAILNFAAFTAVDIAEDKTDEALCLNATLPYWLSDYVQESDRLLIHISTDHIFGEEETTIPYTEVDTPAPINMYGKTKCIGEEAILNISPPIFYILRTAWLYSPSQYGKSFYRTILENARNAQHLRVVADEVGSPTSALTLARVVASFLQLWRKNRPAPKGIYHVVDKGAISRHHFAKTIVALDQTLTNVQISQCRQSELKSRARRPHYSALSTEKIENIFPGIIPTWNEALKEVYRKEET